MSIENQVKYLRPLWACPKLFFQFGITLKDIYSKCD